MKEETKNIILLSGFIYIIIAMVFYLGTAITGYVIYVQTQYELNIAPENFNYNSSLILVDNKISLNPTIIVENIIKINTENIYIISAYRNDEEFTQEVLALDNNTVNIQKEKIFNIIFNNNLTNKDIIRLNIQTTGEATAETIYLCNYNEICDINQSQGSVFVSNEGWYNITLENLNEEKNNFNLQSLSQEQPRQDIIKLDYIDSIKTETSSYTITNIQYPNEAEISSKELNLNGSIQAILINKTLNNEIIDIFYSIDQGSNWINLIDNVVNLNNSNIQLRFILKSDQNQTPEINGINLIYLQSTEETLNETQNTTIETPQQPASSGGGGGGGGGGGEKREEITETVQPAEPLEKTEVYEIPTYQPKEPIIIGQTEVPASKSNTPFLIGLTAKIVYSGKNIAGFLFDNWWWLLLIALLLIFYIYLIYRRRKDKKFRKRVSKRKV